MASEIDGPPGDRAGLGSGGLVGIDEREMDWASRELLREIGLDATSGRRNGRARAHRNATAKKANNATDIATLLIVCS